MEAQTRSGTGTFRPVSGALSTDFRSGNNQKSHIFFTYRPKWRWFRQPTALTMLATPAAQYMTTHGDLCVTAKQVRAATIGLVRGGQEKSQELKAHLAKLEKITLTRPRRFTSKEAYWTRLEKQWAELHQLAAVWHGRAEWLTSELQKHEMTIAQRAKDLDRVTRMFLEHAPETEHVAIARKLRAMGIQAQPAERILAQEHLRQWDKDRDQSRGIGL